MGMNPVRETPEQRARRIAEVKRRIEKTRRLIEGHPDRHNPTVRRGWEKQLGFQEREVARLQRVGRRA